MRVIHPRTVHEASHHVEDLLRLQSIAMLRLLLTLLVAAATGMTPMPNRPYAPVETVGWMSRAGTIRPAAHASVSIASTVDSSEFVLRNSRNARVIKHVPSLRVDRRARSSD